MQIFDTLSQSQLSAIYAVAQHQSDAAKYAPAVPADIHECLYKFASECNCRLSTRFWADLQMEYASTPSVMVCIQAKRVKVLAVYQNAIFGKHLCEMLKQGYRVMWVYHVNGLEVTWKNWKNVYASLITVPTHDDLPVPPSRYEVRRIQINANRERMFDDAASCNRYKKMGKRGFNMAFNEMRAQMRQEAYEKKLRGVVGEAREIMKML